jgi:hypothetical protein
VGERARVLVFCVRCEWACDAVCLLGIEQSRVCKMHVNPAADCKFIVPAPHTRFCKENSFSHQSINQT